VFTAIYGPDGEDFTVVDTPFTWDPERKATNLRVGYIKSAFDKVPPVGEPALEAISTLERENEGNDGRVLDVLRRLGIDLIPLELPNYDLEPLFMILVAEAAAAFDELTRNNLDDLLTWQDKEAWPNLFRAVRLVPAVEYIQANRIRTLVMQEMAQIMERVDVFVAPSFGGNTLTLTNLTGHPAVVLPNGFNDKGSPTSISFIGGLYQDADVLAVAKAYQDSTDFHLQHPPMNYETANR
jgi:Asp-tRNA(Asn)/Glu-tRNA(Gln) amidotransferase A subunit family amidase